MKEIRINWDDEAQELVASEDVRLIEGNRRLRIVAESLPVTSNGWQIDWEGRCPFGRIAFSVDGAAIPRNVVTFADWQRHHGPFKFTVRVFNEKGEIIAELDPGGGSDPPPPGDDWP